MDVGKSTDAHIEDHEIEASVGWVELEHWAWWHRLLPSVANLGYPRYSAGFGRARDAYRAEGRSYRPLRIGEELNDERGHKADEIVAMCRPIYRDVFLISFEMEMGDVGAAKMISKRWSLSKDKRDGRPLPIQRREYRMLKYEAVASFDTLFALYDELRMSA